MTIRDFVLQTHAKLHQDGEHVVLSTRVLEENEKRELLLFGRENKQEIVEYLTNIQQHEEKKAELTAIVHEKIGQYVRTWEQYSYACSRYAASGFRGDAPERPARTMDECYASLTEQELAFFKATVFSNSYYPEKSLIGERAKDEITDAVRNYESIILKMKQEWTDACLKKQQEMELRQEELLMKTHQISYAVSKTG